MGFVVNREQLNDIGERLRQTVDRTLTVVFGVESSIGGPQPSRFDFRGSACYFTYAGFPFILTAKHVLERSPQPQYFFHGKGESSTFPLRSGWCAPNDASFDFAVFGCFQTALDEIGIQPNPFSSLLAPSFDSDDALYYCNGFPAARAVDMPALSEFQITGNPILGKQAVLPKELDPAKFIAIEYPSSINPRGMSGAPVWNLRLHCMDAVTSWSPEAASFAGVVHKWFPDEQVLVASRVELIRDFVPSAISHLREKYGWTDENG